MVIIGTAVQVLIGLVLGEILGQLIFYRFKYGWKVILAFCLTGFVILLMLIVVSQILRETPSWFYIPRGSPGLIGVAFIGWTFFRMKKRAAASSTKGQSDKPPLVSTRASKQPTRPPEIRRESPNDGGREAYGEASSDMKDLGDDELYAIAWQEVEEQTFNKGLRARLFAENKGDENKTKAAYIEHRVKELQIKRKIRVEAEGALKQRQQEEDEERRRQSDVAVTEAQEKRESEEEEKLLNMLRNVQPLPPLDKRIIFGNYIFLSDAVKEINGDKVLQLIRSGADPRGILTDNDQRVQEGLRLNSYLRNIVTVSVGLWEKGILTKSGVSSKNMQRQD